MDDEKKVTVIRDWDDASKWFVELIDQAHNSVRRWFIAWLITLISLIGTNMAWLYVFQSYEYVSQDGEGVNNANSGTQGDLTIGTESKAEEER